MNPLVTSATRAFPLFEEIHSTGMPINLPYFRILYNDFTNRMSRLSITLSEAFYNGDPINPNSDQQTARLCELHNITPTKRTKPTKTKPKGSWSYAKDSIEHYRYTRAPITLLFDWRELAHFRDSFITPVINACGEHNQYTSTNYPGADYFNIMGELQTTRTTSRRPSMKKKKGGVNLLNLPKRQRQGMQGGLAKSIRLGYQCPPDQLLTSRDLSQIEWRLLASESGDPVMCDILNTGQDPHSSMAAKMFGIPLEDVTPNERNPAKNVNFMIGYGGGGGKLFEMFRQAGINDYTVEQCEGFIDSWYEVAHYVMEWKEKRLALARKRGYEQTQMGMRRYLPGLYSRNPGERSAAERECISHRIQGTAADLILNSMGYLYPIICRWRAQGKKLRCALQVYDDLIFRIDREQHKKHGLGDELMELIHDAYVNHNGIDMRVPIESDGAIGRSWGEV